MKSYLKNCFKSVSRVVDELGRANEVVTKAQRGEFVLHERKATLIKLEEL